jgi:hypothetical protein
LKKKIECSITTTNKIPRQLLLVLPIFPGDREKTKDGNRQIGSHADKNGTKLSFASGMKDDKEESLNYHMALMH